MTREQIMNELRRGPSVVVGNTNILAVAAALIEADGKRIAELEAHLQNHHKSTVEYAYAYSLTCHEERNKR